MQLSPDEQTLYIADTLREEIIAYDVASDGLVDSRRTFARLREATEHYSGGDGAAIDNEGRLYVTSRVGVQVLEVDGQHLGTIAIPMQPTKRGFRRTGPQDPVRYDRGRRV